MNIPTDWTFGNAEIADAFDRHVREQLPWYELATGVVSHIARHYIGDGGLVYDIGASTGNIGNALRGTLEARGAELVAIESAPEMAARYAGPGKLVIADALEFPFEPFDVAVCFLIFMFLPVSKRRGFLQKLGERMKPGGVLILFDKVTAPGGYLGTVLHRLTIAGKMATGCEPKEILEKELSLGGVQRPLPTGWLGCCAPQAVEVFRFGEFAGWVLERPEW